MRIAHLTDFHFSKHKTLYDFDKLFDALINSLNLEQQQKKIDFVFVTGDLVDKGGQSFSENSINNCYEIVDEKILTRLSQELGIPREQVIMSPGNHDVQEFSKPFFLRGLRSNPKIEDIHSLIADNQYQWNESALLGLKMFKEFERQYYSKNSNTGPLIQFSNFQTCFVFQFGRAKIGVAAFNSAWSCHSELDKDTTLKLAFGPLQIQEASKWFKLQQTDFNIGLLHHPLNMNFYSEEEENEIQSELTRGGFTILFCGHTHKASNNHNIEQNSNYYLIVTKSTFNNPRIKIEEYKSGFSLIDLSYLQDDRIRVTRHYRKYVKSSGFDFDVDEAFQGMSLLEIKPNYIRPAFIKYLKDQSPHYDSERKLLLDKMNSITQEYLKSNFPAVTDTALKKILNRVLPVAKQFTHYRKNLTLHWKISYVDSQYFKIEEIQTFDIIATTDEMAFEAYAYIDRLVNSNDQSSITIKNFTIDMEDYTSSFKEEYHELPDEGLRVERHGLRLSTKLKNKEHYHVERLQESINNMSLNRAWSVNFKNIYDIYEIIIENQDNHYHIEFFDILNSKFYSNLGADGTLKRKFKIKGSDLLVPGDIFWIFVNNYNFTQK